MNIKVEKFRLNNSLKNAGDMKTEAKAIQDSIHNLDGINAVRVDPFENMITVDYNADQVSLSQIEQKLKENNYI